MTTTVSVNVRGIDANNFMPVDQWLSVTNNKTSIAKLQRAINRAKNYPTVVRVEIACATPEIEAAIKL